MWWVLVLLSIIAILLIFNKWINRAITRKETKQFLKTLKFADFVRRDIVAHFDSVCEVSNFMKNDKFVERFSIVGEPIWRLELTQNVVTYIRYPV